MHSLVLDQEAWMDARVFEEWLLKVDQIMVNQGRKVLLIENAPSHLWIHLVKKFFVK